MPTPALDTWFDTLYAELRRLAHSRLRRMGDAGGLNTTALVHESYLRLAGRALPELKEERQFYAYASQVMRSVVVDLAREVAADRRGGGQVHVTLDTALRDGLPAQGEDQVLALHEALLELQAVDERMARVVEMRWFGGLSMDEIAQALDVAKRTVERDWEKAKLFLQASLNS